MLLPVLWCPLTLFPVLDFLVEIISLPTCALSNIVEYGKYRSAPTSPTQHSSFLVSSGPSTLPHNHATFSSPFNLKSSHEHPYDHPSSSHTPDASSLCSAADDLDPTSPGNQNNQRRTFPLTSPHLPASTSINNIFCAANVVLPCAFQQDSFACAHIQSIPVFSRM